MDKEELSIEDATLQKWGWQSYVESLSEAQIEMMPDIDPSFLARITQSHRGACFAISKDGPKLLNLDPKELLKRPSERVQPVTGDWVLFDKEFQKQSGDAGAYISTILPRANEIARAKKEHSATLKQVLVANVDRAFVVSSANSEYNPNRIERYFFVLKEAGVACTLIVTKTDLLDEPSLFFEKVKKDFPDIDCCLASGLSSEGVEALEERMSAGCTYVLLGSSGVGKSTLVNALLARQVQLTQQARDFDQKGRHTTSTRELFLLESGSMVIDTAGLRELQIMGAEETADSMFEQIKELELGCRFRDCTHGNEKGCAVLKAIKNNDITQRSLDQYSKMKRELAHLENKKDKRAQSNSKRKWKSIHVGMRKRRKFEGR